MLSRLSPSDKLELLIILCAVFFCTMLVISVIAWSNGKDIEYFKERVIMLDNRMNTIDKRTNLAQERQETIIGKVNELTIRSNDLNQKQLEQEKFIEYWKTLPQLPKPPQPKSKPQVSTH